MSKAKTECKVENFTQAKASGPLAVGKMGPEKLDPQPLHSIPIIVKVVGYSDRWGLGEKPFYRGVSWHHLQPNTQVSGGNYQDQADISTQMGSWLLCMLLTAAKPEEGALHYVRQLTACLLGARSTRLNMCVWNS